MAAVPVLERRMIPLADAVLEVFSGGVGEATICSTHQYLAHQDIMRSARAAPFVEALAGAGRLVLVNPRGVGASSLAADRRGLGMEQLVDDLEAVRAQLGGERWVFAGATIGAMVGLLYAVRYPRALRGLILSGGAPSWRFVEEDTSIYHPAHPLRAKLQAALDVGADPAEAQRRWSTLVIGASVHKEELRPAFLAQPGDGTVRARFDAFRDAIGRKAYDVTDRLSVIRVPALITCGRHDPQVPLRQSELLYGGIAASELVVFEESGHFPYAEEPERFGATVRRFMVERVLAAETGQP